MTLALGDATLLRLCLECIAPHRKDGPVAFDPPRMETARAASVPRLVDSLTAVDAARSTAAGRYAA